MCSDVVWGGFVCFRVVLGVSTIPIGNAGNQNHPDLECD